VARPDDAVMGLELPGAMLRIPGTIVGGSSPDGTIRHRILRSFAIGICRNLACGHRGDRLEH